MSDTFPPPVTGPGRPGTLRRDAVLAAALRRLHRRLGPGTCAAYLVSEDGRELRAAMSVDTSLGFTVPPAIPADAVELATAKAFRTGELAVFGPVERERAERLNPTLVLYGPFPFLLASAPLCTARRRYGALSLRWMPPREVGRDELALLRSVGDEVAREFDALADAGVPVTVPPVPRFLSVPPAGPRPPHDPTASGGHEDDAVDELGSTAYLYALQKLTSALAAAVLTRDVVAITGEQLLRPFGGRALMLCLAEEGLLRVVGATGFSREEVRRVDGTPLSRATPETDTVTDVRISFHSTPGEIRRAGTGARRDPDVGTRVHVPLISGGRVVGACVLEFPAPGRGLGFEERAMLMMMLEQVGQSLARARSYEVKQVLAQTMQRSLLPRTLPHLPELLTTARYFPANEGAEVGGDWYDVLRLPDGRIGLVVGDVEGHTMDAVGVMGQLRSAVRAYAAEGHEPAAVLERTNRLLAGLESELYATCCCVWLDLATGAARTASAGHWLPLVGEPDRTEHPRTEHHRAEPHRTEHHRADPGGPASGQPACTRPEFDRPASGRSSSGRSESRRSESRRTEQVVGPPLGIDTGAAYRQTASVLRPGSVLALFTGGLLQARRLGTDAALARLADLLREGAGENLEVLADRLVGARLTHRPPDDDTALLLVRYEGARPGQRQRVADVSVHRHDLQGVGHVRRFLREHLRDWELTALFDDLELLASEVVTNALVHADSAVDLRLRECADRVRVEVRDSDPRPPVPSAVLGTGRAEEEAESGRGLVIVDALAADWGSSPSGRGKTTWFEIGIPR
ncbi:SpoIIE family protein phosphatase [Streptomyces sp. NPDC058417]|uniref:SpoIIE family protein phosphatase n=1 Tax=unclassified Streptomyces TaxID=2593676 RepID=UPI00365048AF